MAATYTRVSATIRGQAGIHANAGAGSHEESVGVKEVMGGTGNLETDLGGERGGHDFRESCTQELLRRVISACCMHRIETFPHAQKNLMLTTHSHMNTSGTT